MGIGTILISGAINGCVIMIYNLLCVFVNDIAIRCPILIF